MLRARSVAVAAVLALSASVASGCGRLYQRPEPTGAAAPCDGQRYLDVHNSFETTLELYGYVGLSSAPRYLGSVAPGSQRVLLAEPVGGVYAESGGRRVTQAGARRGDVGGITITPGCEARD
jgi:hypothetical protein